MLIGRRMAFTLASMMSATAVALPAPSVVASVAITAGPTLLAETSVAVDPTNDQHVVVLADRYGTHTSIVMVESFDGGRSWSRQRALIPPGFTTTYDSTVRFTPTGGLVVAGGAARPTSPGCNADSSVFVADLALSGEVSYRLVRSVSGLNRFTDRPALIVDQRSGATFVSWTESAGPLAACRGRPILSSTRVSYAEPGEAFSAPVQVPSSGLAAPYGSSLAVTATGSLVVAVGEYDTSGRSRLVIAESVDGARTFTLPTVVATRPAPTRRWKWRGWVSAVPSLASTVEGRLAVSWVGTSGVRQSPMVWERTPTGWIDVSPTTAPVGDTVLSTVRFSAEGALWLTSASMAGGVITFTVDRYLVAWVGPRTVSSTPATLRELGELVGLDAAGCNVVVAVPLDASDRSSVLVSRFTGEELHCYSSS